LKANRLAGPLKGHPVLIRTNRTAAVALVGNAPPRRCGIATFTTDLQRALQNTGHGIRTGIVAMNDRAERYDYPASVIREIDAGRPDDYRTAAGFLNGGGYEIVSLQHEFGIFGGESGGHIMTLLETLEVPVVTTLHTVLESPTASQRSVIAAIAARSARIVVMAEKAREFLVNIYGIAPDKIAFIPHGIPDYPFGPPDGAKRERGFADRRVILTFGLLSPNKGIEVMIDAMPAVLVRCPTAVYVVLGATHPNLVREQGEAYRQGLMARVRDLGVAQNVVFVDGFVDQPTLLSYIAMCDVYVTPYLNVAQMTSGTLAYSYGLGRAVVSTPYWHARELLADGKGVLVPFGDAARTGRAVTDLLADDRVRDAMRASAYRASRSMIWARAADRYLDLFDDVRRAARIRIVAPAIARGPSRAAAPIPDIRTTHFERMCDDTGLLQHAVHSVPNRGHGYCVDDNARALLLAAMLAQPDGPALPETLVYRLAAFVQHAWNPETGRFRNFLGFDRNWLEESGSEDSHGRALWALGVCARGNLPLALRRWASALFVEALPAVERFTSPRAWAFTLLGVNAHGRDAPAAPGDIRLRDVLADRLTALLGAGETPDECWFEESLAYDNARLSQALIETGAASENGRHMSAGLRSLRWLNRRQASPAGLYRPAATAGFGLPRDAPHIFDQQPVDAAATIAASVAAWRATGERNWIDDASHAFAWFLGRNDLSAPLVDVSTGACRDGLHADRPNENCGAESAVSYLLALLDIRRLAAESSGRVRAMPDAV
jgi:glycosyltransferase involved in cell wall biosynthesis